MKTIVLPAFRILIVLTVLTGVIYPVAITLAAGVLFPAQAAGSLITVDGRVVGSSLIGQQFTSDRYFWPRPSAIADITGAAAPYGVTIDSTIFASAGSNQGPTNATLEKAVRARADDLRQKNGLAPDAQIPTDLLFASASGLDPHISPEAALIQVNRVAKARGLDPKAVVVLVTTFTEAPQLGFLGQPRVNVLMLNLALDQIK